MCGGATPDAQPANVVLALDRMNAVRSHDTIANTLVAEAGCILGNLRRAADEAGRMLPLSLAAEDSCQIGGNVSSNARSEEHTSEQKREMRTGISVCCFKKKTQHQR